MLIYNSPDYRAKYFEHKDLDKIYGQPKIESILTLLKQCKRNAQTEPTTLGGGQLGYLWFLLKGADYNAISGTFPSIRPVDQEIFSPALNPGGPTTQRGAGSIPLTVAGIETQK